MSSTNVKKKVVKKKKKSNTPIILFYLLIIGATAYGLYYIISNHKLEFKSSNTNSNNTSKNNVEDDPIRDEYKEKLEKLGNIDKKIDFFKMEYIDRYLAYKEKNPDLDDEMIIVYVNIGIDQDFYSNDIDSPNKYTNTVLCNKFYYLGSDYVPKDLTEINSNYQSGGEKVTKDAALAFEKMAKAAKEDGYNIRAVSTYRSYSYQNTLYNNYAAKDGTKKADTYSARPGYSEHQTGLAVDVDNTKATYTQFGSTKEFGWMKENAYKYGFILRYTKETEFITGYINEPWHYRYVGLEIAKYIYEHPMTYEEYYVRFLENK